MSYYLYEKEEDMLWFLISTVVLFAIGTLYITFDAIRKDNSTS